MKFLTVLLLLSAVAIVSIEITSARVWAGAPLGSTNEDLASQNEAPLRVKRCNPWDGGKNCGNGPQGPNDK